MIKWIAEHNLTQQAVLLRVDLNLPIHDNKLLDDSRILAIKETVKFLLRANNKVILMTHFKRPKGFDNALSTQNLVPFLKPFFENEIIFLENCFGQSIKEKIVASSYPSLFLMENIRFYPEETENNLDFAKKIAKLADVYVNEAFATNHRKHASIVSLPKILPSYGGINLQKEITRLTPFVGKKIRKSLCILGGSKLSTKIKYIRPLVDIFDDLFIGGACANTFLKAINFDIQQSLYEQDYLQEAANLADKVLLPQDLVFENGYGYDIGPKTVDLLKKKLESCELILWNGPLGYIEKPPFDIASKEIASASSSIKNVVVGGGETLSLFKNKDHVITSTGGGALLHYFAYGNLPGVDALKEA